MKFIRAHGVYCIIIHANLALIAALHLCTDRDKLHENCAYNGLVL